MDGVLIRPLPFPGEDRLVGIGEIRDPGQPPGSVCYRTFAEMRDGAGSFDVVALSKAWAPSIESTGNAEN
jgi:hypothetical protein